MMKIFKGFGRHNIDTGSRPPLLTRTRPRREESEDVGSGKPPSLPVRRLMEHVGCKRFSFKLGRI